MSPVQRKRFNYAWFCVVAIVALITFSVVIRLVGQKFPRAVYKTASSSNTSHIIQNNEIFMKELTEKVVSRIDTLSDQTLEEIYPGSDVVSREITPANNVSSHTVYYFWCKDDFFTYENYLSVLSVVRNIKPMKIKFYYTKLPRVDSYEYFTWFNDIKRIPYLVLEQLDTSHHCQTSATLKLQTVVQYLQQHRGLYVGEETIVTHLPTHVLQERQLVLLPDQQQLHMQLSNTTHTRVFLKYLNGVIGLQSNTTTELYPQTHVNSGCCVVVDLKPYPESCMCVIPVLDRVLYPKYIWELDNNLGRLLRWVGYGTEALLKPRQDFTNLAPRLSHYIWYGKQEFDFSHYLSVLSAIHVAGMKKVFFHGTFEPYGKYWQKVTSEEDVTFILTDLPDFVFKSRVDVPAHANDIVKMYILHEYGGVHQDPDVYWLNYVSDDELAYDSMMGFEWLQTGFWPETFNIGVFFAKKRSTYIKEFVKTLKDYRDERWVYNSALMTYRTYERMPHVLNADRHLQVLCFLHRCHPPWLNNYNIYELSPDAPGFDFDWRSEALTIHNTIPKPYDELSSMDKLHNSTTMFADVGRFILEKAGKLTSNK